MSRFIQLRPNYNVIFLALGLFAWATRCPAEITVVDKIDPTPGITQYTANRAPLTPSPLAELPLSAVEPRGWLSKQLELQADGFHGRLGEISDFLKKDKNAWLDPQGIGERGWEEVPYWLKGYLGCAYLLKKQNMINEAREWIEGAIHSQQPDGWFGPGPGRTGGATDLKGRDDLWPNMIMLFCLQTYYDCTGDQRVIQLMTKYFRYLESTPESKFLIGYWPSMRGGDQLYSILWLYNRTGEAWLLDLARRTHRHTAHWDEDVIDWHNVNVAQAFREPAIFGQVSKSPFDFDATERDWSKVRSLYGQVPGGMYGADENARPGYNGPRQCIETCGIVEEMLSDEILLAATGNAVWAERCENAAFNTLPASMTADYKALRYLTAPNQPQSDHTNKSPGIQNRGPMFHMNPYDHRCCQHNCGHGWPYFTAHLWYAAPGDGLAALLYAPCEVHAKVAGGREVRIVETTHYPFDEQIDLAFSLGTPAKFPLLLRIPSWCEGAKIAINGETDATKLPAGRLVQIQREWKEGDKLTLTLPMSTKVKVWKENRGFASVNHGPLTYSVAIREEYKRQGGTDAWPAWDIFPASPWNYGLMLDKDNSAAGIQLVRGTWPADDQPFRAENVPLKLTAPAKRIPNWQLDKRGLVEELIESPVLSSEPKEEITLIPMGAARLRITAFPVIGDAPQAHAWPESLKSLIDIKASHCYHSDTTDELFDNYVPKKSQEMSIPRFTWWDHRSSDEWLEFSFAKAKKLSSVQVYWYDDTGIGQCRVPAQWKLLYRDGDQWKPVETNESFGVVKDQFNKVSFSPVTTDAFRLEVKLQPNSSGGILRIRAE